MYERCTNELTQMIPTKGQVWRVKAWWLKGQLVESRIEAIYEDSKTIVVRPLSGNPHARMVNLDDLDSHINGHPAESGELQ
jgi:hypothetical protein